VPPRCRALRPGRGRGRPRLHRRDPPAAVVVGERRGDRLAPRRLVGTALRLRTT
jgi:hypothetical protein